MSRKMTNKKKKKETGIQFNVFSKCLGHGQMQKGFIIYEKKSFYQQIKRKIEKKIMSRKMTNKKKRKTGIQSMFQNVGEIDRYKGVL